MSYSWRSRMLTLASILGGIFCGYFIRTDGAWTAFLLVCIATILGLAFGVNRKHISLFRFLDFAQFVSIAIASRWLVTHGWVE
jgi:hypothetical protein